MTRMSETRQFTFQVNHIFYILLGFILLLTIFTGKLFAADQETAQKVITFYPNVFVDYWCGKDKNVRNDVTMLYVQVCHNDLTFLKSSNGFNARYHLEITAYDKQGELVYEKIVSDRFHIKHYAITRDPDQHRLFKVPLNLSPGDYRLMLKLVDDNSDKQAVFEHRITIVPMNNPGFAVSDILLAGMVRTTVVKNAEHFLEGVLPYPAGIFGVNQPSLFYYFEIYRTKHSNCDSVSYSIVLRDEAGKKQVILKQHERLPGKKLPVFNRINTGVLLPGRYHLEVQAYDRKNNLKLKREKTFYVYQNPLDLRFKTYKQALSEISLIATPGEMKQLKNAPKEEQQNRLREFWKRYDPTPETRVNEVMLEFYRRIHFAQNHFWIGNPNKGSFSDRGKVHVLYGKPDNILREKDVINHVEWEIWEYYNLSLQIVFQDDVGLGNYRLVQPLTLLNY
ncbi:MAG TPA: GWxTD domain-containing protein [Caldithrix sp.]|nr:GWxTD domain-containing protein [Caldithrix sp.]